MHLTNMHKHFSLIFTPKNCNTLRNLEICGNPTKFAFVEMWKYTFS